MVLVTEIKACTICGHAVYIEYDRWVHVESNRMSCGVATPGAKA